MPTIKDIRAIITAPEGVNLIVVKVETDQEGLYGVGCATFAYRPLAVKCVVEDYLKPLLIGRDVHKIEDIWHVMNNNGYWRNGGITNNAMSGVDMALWDIKGKMAGLPVYDLLGGKSREGVAFYQQINERTLDTIVSKVQQLQQQNINHARIQWGIYGGIPRNLNIPDNSENGNYFDPKQYMKDTIKMFQYVRKHVGDDIELIHDIHERLSHTDATYLAKQLEPYRLFYLEDPFPLEQGDRLARLKAQTTTPIAVGELFNNPAEWIPLIKDQAIDFIRVHISQIGGFTPAKKLAILAEQFGIKTAWHGPNDVSPIGHAANLHLSVHAPNFGIVEWCGFSDIMYDIFPGIPTIKNGYMYPNDKPGFGIDINEELARKYPMNPKVTTWTQTRLPDGTLVQP